MEYQDQLINNFNLFISSLRKENNIDCKSFFVIGATLKTCKIKCFKEITYTIKWVGVSKLPVYVISKVYNSALADSKTSAYNFLNEKVTNYLFSLISDTLKLNYILKEKGVEDEIISL